MAARCAGLVLSAYILDELRRVLPKPAHRHGLGVGEIDAFTIQIDWVEPDAVDEPGLADAYDRRVMGILTAALHGAEAAVLITGDKALLALRDRYPIRTPAELSAAHGAD